MLLGLVWCETRVLEWGLLSLWPLSPNVLCASGAMQQAGGKWTGCGTHNWICQSGGGKGARRSPSQLPGSGPQKTAWTQKAMAVKGRPQDKGVSLEYIQLSGGEWMSPR